MARKRILDLNSHKFSMDLSGKNKETVDKINEKTGKKYGPFINHLIELICRMSPRMKEDFINFIVNRCITLEQEIQTAGPMEQQHLKDDLQHYKNIAKYINSGEDITEQIKRKNEEPVFTELQIKNGVLIVPKDWIILNEEDAQECEYAGAVECRNHIKYGIPHFVYLSQKPIDMNFTNEDDKKVQELCCDKWEDFQKKVLDKQVKPIRDTSQNGLFINAKEYLAAPTYGIFEIERIATHDEDIHELPFNARIEEKKENFIE